MPISEVLNTMYVPRLVYGTLVLVSVIASLVIGQDEHTEQHPNQTQVSNCQAAMPTLLKQYNIARYAVQAARNSGDKAHILTEVGQAQAALDAMEQPLKACSEAFQSMKSGKPRDGEN